MKDTVRFESEKDYSRMIHNKTEVSAKIDTDMVEPLKVWMRENGSLYFDGDCFRQIKGNRYPAIKIIAALTYGMDVDQLSLHNIRVKNGDRFDLQAKNISFTNRWKTADHPDCSILYDSEYNAIYNFGINVWLLLKDDGEIVRLDALNIIRNLLIRLIKSGHRITKTPSCSHVMVTDLLGNRRRLADYILAEVYNVPITQVESGKVTYWNNDPLDLTRGNVTSTTVAMPDNKNRAVFSAGDRVYVQLNSGLPHYTDCAAIMRPILEMPIWTWHTKADGRLAACISGLGKEAGIEEPYLYQLRWAVAHYGAIDDYFSIAKALCTMKKDFRNTDSVLDHLDNNFRNCNLWNLSRMKRSENSQKKSMTAKIFAPFFWFSVHTDAGYRILCGDDIDNPQQLFCLNSREYVDVLRRFYETGIGSSVHPKEISDGERIGYDCNGNLTSIGDRMIQYLRIASDNCFTQFS